MWNVLRKRLPWAVLAILAAAEFGHAADNWLSVRSRNFHLVGNASESQIRRVGRNLEEFRAAFATLFPWAAEQSSVAITVVVFKDDTSFRPFKPLYGGKPANVAGYFQAGSDANFIALSGDVQTPHVIYHEFVHSLTKDAVALPVWTSEGLAEFYSNLEIAGKEILVGRAMGEHVGLLNEKSFLPLDTFFSVEHGSPYYNESTKQGIFYAQSWATVHYLMLGNNGQRRPQFSKYLSLIAGGKSINESFREAFQADYAAMEGELFDYVRNRLTWPAIKVKLENKIDFEREMQVSAISEAQAQYYLGDLLLHTGRLDVAEAQLQKAMSLDSKLAGSFASMGLLRVRQQRYGEALKFLSQAVQADSQNHMAHFYYAQMLQAVGREASVAEQKSQFELMRQHLKKSIELAPRFVEAYSMLGYVTLVLRDEVEDTEQLLKKAVGLAPGRHELRFTLAELMLLHNEPIAARVILTQLMNQPLDDATRSQAEALLENIAAGLDNEKALREYEERRQAAEVASNARDSSIEEKTADEPPKLTRNDKPRPAGPVVETATPQFKDPSS